MSGPAASETRSPFCASSEIGACSVGGPSPAATSSAPRSCGRARRRETRSPPVDDGRARRVTVARARPLLPVPWRSFRCSVEIGQYLGSVALMHDRG
jgi:hypothetical protein